MNNFPYAYEPLKRNEGGYVNDPADPGGETYGGISRKAWPSWEGWKILDTMPNKKRGQLYSVLDTVTAAFYFHQFWIENKLDLITDKDIAAAALDTVVNHGRGPYLIQQALQKLGQPVAVDGRIGQDTLAHINALAPKAYLPALYDVREDYYQGLVAANPALAKFLPGWLSRIDKYKGVAASGGLLGLAAVALGVWYYLKRKTVS